MIWQPDGIELCSIRLSGLLSPPRYASRSMKQPPEENLLSGYAITVVNKNHYITADLELNATITGFNDVTPKPGAQRLVAMSDGKPDPHRMALWPGQSGALTTDDGSAWAGIALRQLQARR